MTVRLLVTAAGLLALAGPALAQTAAAGGPRSVSADPDALEQFVVTASASGFGLPTTLLGVSATVIDRSAVEARQARLVSDLLRDAPGVAVNRSGGAGGQTQVRIRGGESNHTFVLIDGIAAADPGVGEYDFAGLYADMGAHLEVLRGQQPVYGSSAMGGVIHYITATGAEQPGLQARIEGGSFGAAHAAVRLGAVRGPLDISLSAGYSVTDGTPTARLGSRELDARNNSFSGKAILSPRANLRLIAVGRYAETYADYNPSDYASAPTAPTYGLIVDGTNFYYARQRMGLLRGELDAWGGRWTHGLAVQGNAVQRRNFNDRARPAAFTDAARVKYTYDSTLRLKTGAVRHTLTGVVDYDRSAYRNLPLTAVVTAQNARRHINDFALVGQYDLDWMGRLGLGAAFRHDHNTRFRNATSWRLQGSYRFEQGTRLHGAWGSGVTNPTFVELYGFDPATFIGNPDLRPERSRGWEAGVEQTLAAGNIRFGAAYFSARLRDEIHTVFTPAFVSSTANRTTLSRQHGLELTAAARLGRRWRLDGAYTRLQARERGMREIRRPKHTASLNATWRSADDRFGTTLTVRYNGRMTDSYFGATTQTKALDAFTLVNLSGEARLGRGLALYGRVENLLGERYEEIYGFRSPGRGAWLGLKAAL